MEAALPTPAFALEIPRMEDVPWSFLMAFASLGLIYYLFRRRGDLFHDLGFAGPEVALLCLGSIAGWAVNIPIWISGDTYLMVNAGGALVPLVLVGLWLKQRRIKIIPLVIGTAIVSIVAWKVVRFHPEIGIISSYPYFFLPVAVALVFAAVVSIRRPLSGAPLAYAVGSLGALVGADLFNVPLIHEHFVRAPGTFISIGGAGVFDMVFLAGTSAMALQLAIAVSLGAKGGPPDVAAETYPTPPLTLRDSRRVSEHFTTLAQPNPLERALAGLALSNLALRDAEYARSIRMSWLAVDSLVQTPGVQQHLRNGVSDALKGDIEHLQQCYQKARTEPPSLRVAGEANSAAKILTTALAPHTGLRHQLEGVA